MSSGCRKFGRAMWCWWAQAAARLQATRLSICGGSYSLCLASALSGLSRRAALRLASFPVSLIAEHLPFLPVQQMWKLGEVRHPRVGRGRGVDERDIEPLG